MKWLVTWESQDHPGLWVSEPTWLPTKKAALQFMKDARDALLTHNQMVLYKCEHAGRVTRGRKNESVSA
jgi:hypothetical protein